MRQTKVNTRLFLLVTFWMGQVGLAQTVDDYSITGVKFRNTVHDDVNPQPVRAFRVFMRNEGLFEIGANSAHVLLSARRNDGVAVRHRTRGVVYSHSTTGPWRYGEPVAPRELAVVTFEVAAAVYFGGEMNHCQKVAVKVDIPSATLYQGSPSRVRVTTASKTVRAMDLDSTRVCLGDGVIREFRR